MEEVVACQISYLPLGTENVEEKVEKVLLAIVASGLECEVGAFATECRGSRASVFSLLQEIFALAEAEGRFVLDVKLSNTCGCSVKSSVKKG